MPPTPPGDSGEIWGFFTAELVGYVGGIPQHVGEIFATAHASTTGGSVVAGDWSAPGYLFSRRVAEIESQPPLPQE